MRILLLTPQPPYPPHAGGALRTLGLLEGLHQAGHTIDLLSFISDSAPDPLTTPAAALCQQITTIPLPARSLRRRLRDLLTGRTDMAQRFASTAFTAALSTHLRAERYDVIQAEGLEVAAYLQQAKTEQPEAALIYSSTNAEYELQRVMFRADRLIPARWPRAIYSLIQSQRLARFERAICRLSNLVIATSQPDARCFERLAPGVKIYVVPNGIHTADYAGASSSVELGGAALMFTGSMNYRPNVDAMLWFAEQVLDRVTAAVPNTRLYIVGQQPHPRLDPLRQRRDVQITGFVQDVSPFLHSCTVYVAPLQTGGGTRLKLLQAMAARCAIVTTSIGALGLDIVPGTQALIADDALSFAQAVIALLNDASRRAALGQAAETLVRTTYDWAAIAPKLRAVYDDPALHRRG